MFGFSTHKESFYEASRKEKEETIEKLISQGTMRSGYYFMLVLASLIVTPGIFLDNTSVLIGGMILAPLMVPLLSLSLSLVSGNIAGCLRSIKILLISILIALLTSAVMTLVLSKAYGTVPWYPQSISPGIYIFIAFCSGIAGAFAWIKEDMASAVAGVATAVALLPPLCNAGIGMALGEFALVRSALTIFSANLLGITMAAFFVFWVMGFLNTGKMEERLIKKL